MDATIKIDRLHKRFGETQALDGMTFTVRPGQVTGFSGPNGAGKPVTKLGHSLLSGAVVDRQEIGLGQRCGVPFRPRPPGMPAHRAYRHRPPVRRPTAAV